MFKVSRGARVAMRKSAGGRLALIAESFERLAGQPLVTGSDPLEQAMWRANRIILAHGTESDPLFFYGNRAALELFAMDAPDFIGMPSHRSTEPSMREERERMLERLQERGIIHDYRSVRVNAEGRRFEIFATDVWNLVDQLGARHGQAARISGYRFLC